MEHMANPDDPYWKDKAHEPSLSTVDRLEQRLWEVVNLERIRRGQASLRVRADLCRVARAHSEAMRDQRFFAHEDPRGRGPRDRVREALKDETLQGEWDVAENIAKVRDSGDVPRDLVNNILREPAERGRMLDEEANYRGIGVGIACDGPACVGTVLFLK
jgi:uncharacterized protein YkwD